MGETRYVDQLLKVYAEKYPAEALDRDVVSKHPLVGKHFRRQRKAFYSAEALRLYARDSVPEGTFEALQSDVHAGIVEIAEAEHDTGMARLVAVLSGSASIDLSSHALMTVTNTEDRKGICHQLANDQRLSWMSVR